MVSGAGLDGCGGEVQLGGGSWMEKRRDGFLRSRTNRGCRVVFERPKSF